MTTRGATPGRAIGLYTIIGFKLLKGMLLASLALGVYTLIDDDLPRQYDRMLRWVRIDPEREFFENVGQRLAGVTPSTVGWLATGTLLYGLFSVVEAIGLLFRSDWAGWLAIGESGFFVPIEIHHLMRGFSATVFVILLVNIWIVVYLIRNRRRLFRHHGC